MKMKFTCAAVALAALAAVSAPGASSSSASTCSSSNCIWGNPSIPPAATRQPYSARVLAPGVGRSGFHLDQMRAGAQAQRYQYPLDNEGRATGAGVFSTWGLPPGGLEVGGGFVYPFFVPYFQMRYQALGQGWDYGPFLTLEAGLNMIPDLHAGLVLGGAFSEQIDLHAAYRLGKHLDRDYGEWSGGFTVRATNYLDIGVGGAYRTYWGVPYSGDLARFSLVLGFGNPPRATLKQLSVIAKKDQDPYKLYESGDYAAAALVFKDEISYQPDEPRLWQWLGHSLRKAGQAKEARRAFAKARALKQRLREDEIEAQMEKDDVKLEDEPLPEKILP